MSGRTVEKERCASPGDVRAGFAAKGEVVRFGNGSWHRKRCNRRSDRGAAMVEFALVLPIFLALVFGVISFGYMLSFRQAISQAAAEGARAAAITPPGVTDAIRTSKATAAINDALSGYGITCTSGQLREGSKVVGTCAVPAVAACPSDATRRCATVTVMHQYRANPLIPNFPGLGFSLPEKLKYTAVIEVG